MELERLKNQILLFEKAYLTLQDACEQGQWNDLEKLGTIQRFEYTIEIAWKTGKKFLEYHGMYNIHLPKEVFKELYRIEKIHDLELFFRFLDIRNQMSHMYSEYLSLEGFDMIQKHYNVIGDFLAALKNTLE